MSNNLPPQRAAKPARSTASTAILIATSVVGGLALLGTASSAVLGLTMPEPWEVVDSDFVDVSSEDSSITEYYDDGSFDTELYADATGVTSIEIDAAASDFTLKFDDVDKATLTVHAVDPSSDNSANGWTLERDGDELVVDREIETFVGDKCPFGCDPDTSGPQQVTLTLPHELGDDRAASLDVVVTAGAFTGTGSFDEVALELNAGDLDFEGDARLLDVEVRVGDANIEAADVEEADVSVTAGSSTIVLSGEAPTDIELAAQMGALTVQLPEASYRVDTSGVVGEIDNRLRVSKDSAHVVEVEAKASEIVLK